MITDSTETPSFLRQFRQQVSQSQYMTIGEFDAHAKKLAGKKLKKIFLGFWDGPKRYTRKEAIKILLDGHITHNEKHANEMLNEIISMGEFDNNFRISVVGQNSSNEEILSVRVRKYSDC